MEALSPRSANLPMKPPTVIKKTKTDTRTKPAQSIVNHDKIEEKWRPAAVVREPGPDGDTYLTGKKLGRGGFAVCFEGRSDRTRDVFALKVVKSHVEQKKQLEKVVLVFKREDDFADWASSFEQNCRSMRKCTIPASLNSIEPSLSKIIPTSCSSCVRMAH
jgi:hypothetical protein